MVTIMHIPTLTPLLLLLVVTAVLPARRAIGGSALGYLWEGVDVNAFQFSNPG